jgi:hypothetical protein
MKKYKEFQFAWWTVAVFGFFLFMNTSLFINTIGDTPMTLNGYLLSGGVLLSVFLLFYGMTTKIDDRKITITFGIGLIRKQIAIDKISQVSITKNPWYYGRGIRLIPNGKLYNIQGNKAVELAFHASERIIRIGTKDPAHLKIEIEKFVKQ